jgi:micrococcal nuclease
VCFLGERDINAELVRSGLALAYRAYDNRYAREEDAAREEKVGLWQGRFDEPWDWRRGRREVDERRQASRTARAPKGRAIGLPSCAAADCDCSDLSSQAEAQRLLNSEPGDPHRLDGDRDGVARESLP